MHSSIKPKTDLNRENSSGIVTIGILIIILGAVAFLGYYLTSFKRVSRQPENVLAQVQDTISPSAPTNIGRNGTWSAARSMLLWWSPSSDNVAVAGYYVYRNGVKVATVPVTEVCRPDIPYVCYNDMGLEPSTPYNYSVEAFDAANNVSSSILTQFSTYAIEDGVNYERKNHILGWVYGPKGEVIKAKVTLTSPTGKKQTYFTPYISKNPEYGFPDLTPGVYSLLYQAPGLVSQKWNLEVFDDVKTVKLVNLKK